MLIWCLYLSSESETGWTETDLMSAKKTQQSVRCVGQCSSASVGCIWQFYQQPCDFLEATGLAGWWKLGGSQKSQQRWNLCFWLPSSESNKTLLQITISALKNKPLWADMWFSARLLPRNVFRSLNSKVSVRVSCGVCRTTENLIFVSAERWQYLNLQGLRSVDRDTFPSILLYLRLHEKTYCMRYDYFSRGSERQRLYVLLLDFSTGTEEVESQLHYSLFHHHTTAL